MSDKCLVRLTKCFELEKVLPRSQGRNVAAPSGSNESL